jgi:hypothetical protein
VCGFDGRSRYRLFAEVTRPASTENMENIHTQIYTIPYHRTTSSLESQVPVQKRETPVMYLCHVCGCTFDEDNTGPDMSPCSSCETWNEVDFKSKHTSRCLLCGKSCLRTCYVSCPICDRVWSIGQSEAHSSTKREDGGIALTIYFSPPKQTRHRRA